MNATLVTNLNDILENISTFESYLSKTTSPEYKEILGYIKRGLVFLCIYDKSKNRYSFYPSRLLGYKENTLDKHLHYHFIDGRETNAAISKCLKQECKSSTKLEIKYNMYCQEHGIEPYNRTRKYWYIEEQF